MPIDHTLPPSGSAPSTPAAAQDLGDFSDLEPPLGFTGKKGRKTSERKRKSSSTDDSESRTIIAEMRILFSNFATDQEKQFVAFRKAIDKSLDTQIESFRTELADFSKSFEYLAARQEDMVKELRQVKAEHEQDKKQIRHLEDQVDYLYRLSRKSCIEIRNIPLLGDSVGTETKPILCETVKKLGQVLNSNIDTSDIKDIYRTKSKKESNKHIVIEFTSAMKKEHILSSLKMFNKGKKSDDKLNTVHLQITGPKIPIYVSELLTAKAKSLFYMARDFAKTYNYNYCWTSNGIIYLRKKDNAALIKINNESDLNKLRQPK